MIVKGEGWESLLVCVPLPMQVIAVRRDMKIMTIITVGPKFT